MLCLNYSQASRPGRDTQGKNSPSTLKKKKKGVLIFKVPPWERVCLCVRDSLRCKKNTPPPSLPHFYRPGILEFFSYFPATHKSGRTGGGNQWPVSGWPALPGTARFCPNIAVPQSARRHFVNGLFDGFIFTRRFYGPRHIKSNLTLSGLRPWRTAAAEWRSTRVRLPSRGVQLRV